MARMCHLFGMFPSRAVVPFLEMQKGIYLALAARWLEFGQTSPGSSCRFRSGPLLAETLAVAAEVRIDSEAGVRYAGTSSNRSQSAARTALQTCPFEN